MRHIPRKRFGQNFLTDPAVIDAIVATVDPKPDDRMFEIGPGLGALTRPLAGRVRSLHVIEIDRDLAARLGPAVGSPGLVIHQADVLDFDFSRFGPDVRIVGNLPYNISSPILFRLVRYAASLRDIHVMLQKEVVERMVALPGTSDYGRLTVMLQYRFDVERLLEVPASAFDPAPQVESAVARLIPVARQVRARDESMFAGIVTSAFAQRRKMLGNSLKAFLKSADFAQLGINPRARAQELAVDDFVHVANYLARQAGEP
jgi:16S rRNA (adenine1518-N6/adenine1519-N6)-dimethyltransferase